VNSVNLSPYGDAIMQELIPEVEKRFCTGFFLYGDGKGHCWSGPESTAERLTQMAAHIARQKPEGMTTPWWRY
jgi:hypothetical protein